MTATRETPTATPAPDDRRRGFRVKDLRMMFGGGQSTARQFGILGALVVIVIVSQIVTGGRTLEPSNLINLVNGNAYVLILAIGMVMVIIAGHIDLSVGSVAAFVGVIVAISMDRWQFPWPLAILLGIVLGAVVGAWQGFWVAYVGVPAFIVTLAGLLFFRGANQFFGNSTAVPVPRDYAYIGGGYLPEVGPDTGYNNLTLLLGLVVAVAVVVQEIRARRVQERMGAERAPIWVSAVKVGVLLIVVVLATLLFAGGRVGTSYPFVGIIVAALVLLYAFLTRHTIIGRHIYALGGNWRAAELSGVNIRRVNFFVMVNMSVLASIAGMTFIARSVSSGAQDGTGWELDAIAAVFIGGAAVSGGIGTVVGSIIGALVIAVLNNFLQLQSVDAPEQQMIKGLVLLFAVAVDVYSKRQGKPSITGLLLRRRTEAPSAVDTGAQTHGPSGEPQETARPKDLTPRG